MVSILGFLPSSCSEYMRKLQVRFPGSFTRSVSLSPVTATEARADVGRAFLSVVLGCAARHLSGWFDFLGTARKVLLDNSHLRFWAPPAKSIQSLQGRFPPPDFCSRLFFISFLQEIFFFHCFSLITLLWRWRKAGLGVRKNVHSQQMATVFATLVFWSATKVSREDSQVTKISVKEFSIFPQLKKHYNLNTLYTCQIQDFIFDLTACKPFSEGLLEKSK